MMRAVKQPTYVIDHASFEAHDDVLPAADRRPAFVRASTKLLLLQQGRRPER
jgi:hypothetical protein